MSQKLTAVDGHSFASARIKIVLKRLLRPLLLHPKVMAFRRSRYPQFLGYADLRRKSKNPQTFASKITHRLAYDRRSLLHELSDKHAVREFVKQKVGEEYLAKLLSVWEGGQKVDWESLPREFVAKSTHGVGGSLIVRDGAIRLSMDHPPKEDDWRIHVVNPADLSNEIAESYFNKWVNQRYDRFLLVPPSWGYKKIPPKVLFEELLTTSNGDIPNDHKFFCFDGVCKFVQVDIDRFGSFKRNFYTPQWESVDAQLLVPNSSTPISRPKELKKMIEVAETLSNGLDFASVDLYDIGGRIVFGEISFYHGNGNESFSPQSMEEWVGSLWTLPKNRWISW